MTSYRFNRGPTVSLPTWRNLVIWCAHRHLRLLMHTPDALAVMKGEPRSKPDRIGIGKLLWASEVYGLAPLLTCC